MKKLAIGLIVAVMSVLGVVMLPAQKVSAANSCENHFLGLSAWYDGLVEEKTVDGKKICQIKTPNGDAEVKSYVWTIALNIVSMVLGIVGYLAVALVMWGGIQYMTAQGEPVKLAKGKKTITNSLIGLIIVMTASIISGAISGIISGAASAGNSGKDFFGYLFGKVFFWSGIIAVLMIVYGGIQYITSAGNPSGLSKAKTTIIYSVVGLLIVIAAAAIVNVVLGAMPE